VLARRSPPLFRAAPAILTLILALALLVGVSGCGEVAVSSVGTPLNRLTVYSSLPMQGPTAKISRQVENGEKLALAQAGGRVGRLKIGYASLDDANPQTGEWSPEITDTNAKIAAQDTGTIAYLGDWDSAASAVSLPLINAAGILQVSPASPYEGLTSSLDAGQDEPERFYLTGQRTFGRLMPSDAVQAAAQVRLMRRLRVRRLYVVDDQDPFNLPLAAIVAEDAQRARIAVLSEDGVDTVGTTEFGGEVHKIVESGAQAVFFSGQPNAGAVALWQQLHAADPRLRLLGPSALTEGPFAAQIGAAGAEAFLTTPALPTTLYPASAQAVLGDYGRRFGEPAGPYALYGYEAMSVVLAAIHRAGRHGDDRQAVIKQFFATRDRDSVLGRYSMLPSGETTLSRFAVDRVAHRRLVFWRALEVG
jgi:branched-chain amino acid transport system substrate-binding protein